MLSLPIWCVSAKISNPTCHRWPLIQSVSLDAIATQLIYFTFPVALLIYSSGKIGFRDKGLNGSVKYRLSDQTALRYGNLFHLDPISGQLLVTAPLDRERQDWYEVDVIAYDRGQIFSLSSQVCLLCALYEVWCAL